MNAPSRPDLMSSAASIFADTAPAAVLPKDMPAAQDMKISVPPRGELPVDLQSAAGRAPPPGMADEIRKARERLHAAASTMLEDEKPDAAPTAPHVDVESLEIQLPNGLLVEFGPPSGISLTMRVAMLFPNASSSIDMIARVCLSVRTINGRRVKDISNEVTLTQMCNVLGDVGLDLLGQALVTHWAGMKLSDLQIVKKNLRQL